METLEMTDSECPPVLVNTRNEVYLYKPGEVTTFEDISLVHNLYGWMRCSYVHSCPDPKLAVGVDQIVSACVLKLAVVVTKL